MFVDTGLLHSGANVSYEAGGHAQHGADQLSHQPLLAGMFGDFAAAHGFHEAVSSAHAQHVRNLQTQHQTLTALAAKAHRAAAEFTRMDERNAAELRAVRCSSDTSASRT
jgi:hypothetical protein